LQTTNKLFNEQEFNQVNEQQKLKATKSYKLIIRSKIRRSHWLVKIKRVTWQNRLLHWPHPGL